MVLGKERPLRVGVSCCKDPMQNVVDNGKVGFAGCPVKNPPYVPLVVCRAEREVLEPK